MSAPAAPRRPRLTTDSGPFALVPRELLRADLSDGAVRLYAVLADHADRETGVCWPGRRRLGEIMGCSKPTVDRRVKELEAAGWVDVERQQLDGEGWRPNLYVVRRTCSRVSTPSPTGEATPSRVAEVTLGPQVMTEEEPGNQNQKEPSTPTSSEPRATLPAVVDASPYLEHARRLCDLLCELIEANGSKRPTVSKAWVETMDRLMRLDGRTPEQVEAAIRWCQADEFWQANILSPTKLRSQYDRLRLQAKRQQTGPRDGSLDAMLGVLDDLDGAFERDAHRSDIIEAHALPGGSR